MNILFATDLFLFTHPLAHHTTFKKGSYCSFLGQNQQIAVPIEKDGTGDISEESGGE